MMTARMAMVQRKLWHVLGALTLSLALWQGPLLYQPPVAHAAEGTTAVVQKSEPIKKEAMKKALKKKQKKKSGLPSVLFVGGAMGTFAYQSTKKKSKTTNSGNDSTTTLDPTAVPTTTTTTVAEAEAAASSWSSTELTVALETATILPPVAPLPEVRLIEETVLDAKIAEGEVESEADTIIVDDNDDDMAMGEVEETKALEPALAVEEEPVPSPSEPIVEEPVEVKSTEEAISETHQDEPVEEKDEHLPPTKDIVVGTYRYLGCRAFFGAASRTKIVLE
jgi:Tfp pilus assembly major pilin PilA